MTAATTNGSWPTNGNAAGVDATIHATRAPNPNKHLIRISRAMTASTYFSSSSSDFFLKYMNTTMTRASFLLSFVVFLSAATAEMDDARWRRFIIARRLPAIQKAAAPPHSLHTSNWMSYPKFIRFVSRSVVCNKVIWLLESQALKCWKLNGHLKTRLCICLQIVGATSWHKKSAH